MIDLDPNNPLSVLLDDPAIDLSEADKERHNIFVLLTLALVYDHWCIQRNDKDVVAEYAAIAPGRRFGEYVGHNIGALLVNADNRIVTYAFNNNYLFNNSTEHAETRLVRKGMRLYNRDRYKSGAGLFGYSNILDGHTVYTSLESCSQCSGIMDLANVTKVVYAQVDPGQGHIGNVLYNMHRDEGKQGAPFPIRADFVPIFAAIDEAYTAFGDPEGAPGKRRPGVSTFLRSTKAFEVYARAAQDLEFLALTFDENRALLDDALRFRGMFTRAEGRDAIFGE